MVHLSLSARILLNVEALNMIESIGNLVRRRRAPIVIPLENGGYILRYTPAISGETLAHAYQEILASLATKLNLPVCNLCRQGVFIKHSDKTLLSSEPWGRGLSTSKDIEEAIVKNCVVEDIGGFLYAETPPTKRTARFEVGYMIPALDSITASAMEAQFHVRHVPIQKLQEKYQTPYNVEISSALYIFNFNLNIDDIGYATLEERKQVINNAERVKRIELAIKALGIMLSSALFGAKRTRFYPSWRVMSAAILISHPAPITATPAHYTDYIADTANRAISAKEFLESGSTRINEELELIYYATEKIKEPKANKLKIKRVDNLEKLFNEALTQVLNMIKG